MQKTLTTTPTTTRQSLWQILVMGLLQKMDQGFMEVTLPSGQLFTIGESTSGIRAEIRILDEAFFRKCALYGDIGFGEAYVEGLWETPNITKVISWFLLNVHQAPTLSGSKVGAGSVNLLRLVNKLASFARANTKSGSRKNISDHYDLNNEFFAQFLDPTMTYSAAYFTAPDMTLEAAQYAKYQALANRVNLKSTDHVLEIGTGWGGNAIFMAKNYGCRVTTTTISEEQYKLAVERVENEGLTNLVTVLLSDYRDLEGSFDKIVSIEMLEAVGHQYLETYFTKCHSLLKPDGMLGLQVITCPDSRFEELKNGVDWIQKHIFPGSLLPSISAINQAVNKTGDMTLVNLEDMGLHYGKTLKIWHEAFNENWRKITKLGFDDTFRRKWNYYLCYCEAAFNMRNINVMQLVYTRPNNLSWK